MDEKRHARFVVIKMLIYWCFLRVTHIRYRTECGQSKDSASPLLHITTENSSCSPTLIADKSWARLIADGRKLTVADCEWEQIN